LTENIKFNQTVLNISSDHISYLTPDSIWISDEEHKTNLIARYMHLKKYPTSVIKVSWSSKYALSFSFIGEHSRRDFAGTISVVVKFHERERNDYNTQQICVCNRIVSFGAISPHDGNSTSSPLAHISHSRGTT